LPYLFNLIMTDLTSWDNYSDLSSDEGEDIYRSSSITETGKNYMMKKYINYVKGAFSVIFYYHPI
jgi:hypothetical protein